MRIRGALCSPDKVEQQMTPMIDIVFQLLVFFILSFKIAALEGDFGIKMPLGTRDPFACYRATIPIRLTSGPSGELAGIRLGERPLPDFDALHNEILSIVGTQAGPASLAESAEVRLDADYDLDYRHVISAITAVSGRTDPNGRNVKLIEKIKFSPPRQPRAQ